MEYLAGTGDLGKLKRSLHEADPTTRRKLPLNEIQNIGSRRNIPTREITTIPRNLVNSRIQLLGLQYANFATGQIVDRQAYGLGDRNPKLDLTNGIEWVGESPRYGEAVWIHRVVAHTGQQDARQRVQKILHLFQQTGGNPYVLGHAPAGSHLEAQRR